MIPIPYRGRFAPTPSGPLHFGSLVAAVGSFLEAKTHGGKWLLRIDDLDPPRIAPHAVDDILRTLDEFGLHYDDKVIYQNARTEAYRHALYALRNAGLVYACACSRKDIATVARVGAEGPIYPGTCRDRAFDADAVRAWRLNVAGAKIRFEDGVLGMQQFDLADEFGDFVVYRSDGVYAFHLASAVDDIEYGITDVVRGADLLESSARQIFVLEALEKTSPRYAHLPIARDDAGNKLSKQTHAPPISSVPVVPMLCRALRFLRQSIPAELEDATLTEVWQYAQTNWQLARLRSPAQSADVIKR